MRLRLPRSFHRAISKKYLDWAEALPKFNGGMIAHLQHIRRMQHEDARRVYDNSRSSDKSKLTLLSFTLFEMYSFEEFGRLQYDILRLFPNLDDALKHSQISSVTHRLVENSLSQGWHVIGVLHRSNDRLFGAIVTRKVPELPEEVEFIDIKLHKISPAIAVLTFEVHLNDKVNSKIQRMHSKKYLSEIRFSNLLPLSEYKLMYDSMQSREVMQREVLGVIEDIRIGIEILLKPILKGLFSRYYGGSGAKLPIIEVYALEGLTDSENAVKEWRDKSYGWLESLGIDIRENLFASEVHIFALSQMNNWIFPSIYETRFACQMIVNWDKFISSPNSDTYHDKKFGAAHSANMHLEEILPLVVVFQFTELIRKNLDKLNQSTLEGIRSRRNMSRYIDISAKLQREYTLLDRINSEYNSWKSNFSSDSDNPMNLHYASFVFPGSEDIRLFSTLVQVIDRRLGTFTQQMKHVRESFTDHLALANITVTYRLQWISTIFTIVSVVIAIIGLIAIWPNIQEFFRNIGITVPATLPTSTPTVVPVP